MTTVYLIRHSKPLKVNNALNKDILQIQNEKNCLSIEGEKIAEDKFKNEEFDNIHIIYSSNYVRAIQTAKYLAEKNNLEINVFSELGERKIGVSSWDELPEKFELKQFLDENYKIGDGENQIEVIKRMKAALKKILDENKNKRIAVIGHATAIAYYLKDLCDITYKEEKFKYSFNNKTLLHGFYDYCETLRLDFDEDNKIIDINLIN